MHNNELVLQAQTPMEQIEEVEAETKNIKSLVVSVTSLFGSAENEWH